jgi:hypothetical protein
VGRCNTFFEEYWQYVLKQNVIRVPEDCPTMNQAMDLAVIFSERNDCTRVNPVKVVVGEGQHEMVGMSGLEKGNKRSHRTHRQLLTQVRCNNITIAGKGKGKTTILGGFCVNGGKNVKIEQLAVINDAGNGLFCEGNGTNVDVTECCFKKCKYNGMYVRNGTTVSSTRCDFMENGQRGVLWFGGNTKVRLNDSTILNNTEAQWSEKELRSKAKFDKLSKGR